MSRNPKLAIFDVDGTIAVDGKVDPTALDGIKHLKSRGCITTLSTGRGYARLKHVLGSSFNEIISDDAIIITEHGTKLVNKDGKIVFGEFLSSEEIEHIIDFVRANIDLYKLAWFNHEDSQKIYFWCAFESDLDEEIAKRGHYAEVFTSSLGELKERLLKEHLTSLGFKLKEHVKVENLKLSLTRTQTNLIFQDGNMEFIRSNVNKGLAVLEVLKQLNISKADTLIAGNAINDVEMLDIGAGNSVLVGAEDYRKGILPYLSDPESIICVDSPASLGEYLQNA